MTLKQWLVITLNQSSGHGLIFEGLEGDSRYNILLEGEGGNPVTPVTVENVLTVLGQNMFLSAKWKHLFFVSGALAAFGCGPRGPSPQEETPAPGRHVGSEGN